MIVDAHNDVLLELVVHSGAERRFELVLRTGEERPFERYWLPRLEAGGVGVQICPLYAATVPREEARGWVAMARPSPNGVYEIAQKPGMTRWTLPT